MLQIVESKAEEFKRTRLACIVYIMTDADFEELKRIDHKAWVAARGELGFHENFEEVES